MGKIRNTYRTYSTNAMKVRSSIPLQANIIEGAGYIDCTNVSAYGIRDLLGAANAQLYTLCPHASVNKWSAFGPTVRTLSGIGFDRVLVNSAPVNNFSQLSFGGYNHNAVTPGWQSGGQAEAQADIWVNNNDKASFSAKIDIGEIDYHTEFGAHGVAMLIFDASDNPVGWGQTDLSTIGSSFTLTGESINTINTEHLDWYGMAFIVDTYPILQAEDVISAIVCRVPNISTWTVKVKVKYASSWIYTDTNTMTLPSPWVQNSSAAMNWGTGVFNIGSIARLTACNVRIKARLVNWLDELVTSAYIVGDGSTYYAYDPMDGIDITGSVDLGDSLNWGYKVYVYFEYSI